MIFLTTTAQDVDEELLNCCLVLTVNEEQTRAIHREATGVRPRQVRYQDSLQNNSKPLQHNSDITAV